MSLSNDELVKQLELCLEDVEQTFSEDAPPLDTGPLYQGIYQKIMEERKALAEKWIEANVPPLENIGRLKAVEAQQLKKRLTARSAYLSDSQAGLVQEALDACEARLDELEVEGLWPGITVVS